MSMRDRPTINRKTNMVTKRKDIYFKSNVLLTPYILSDLASILRSEKIKGSVFKNRKIENFLIYTEDLMLANGNDVWDIEIREPESNDIMLIPIHNTSFCIQRSKNNVSVIRPTPFSHVGSSSENLAVSVENPDSVIAKYLAMVGLKLMTAEQLQLLASAWDSEITVYYPDKHYVFSKE